MQAQGQSRGLAVLSCDEPRVSEPLPCDRINERVQPFERVASNVAVVQAERELIHIAAKMFLADLVVDAVQSALEDRPHALNTVCARYSANVLASRVIHTLLAEEQTVQIIVGSMLIGEESRTDFDVTVNGVLDFLH